VNDVSINYKALRELYAEQIKTVTSNPDDWASFLRSASYNYKLPFEEQLLIYAQRPDATAVLEIERWNKQFGRWVNKGSRGIAVFGSPGAARPKYYFDISDTNPSKYAREVPIWEMYPDYEADAIEALEGAFGFLSNEQTLQSAIEVAANNAAIDNMDSYFEELLEVCEGSGLEGLESGQIAEAFKDAIEASVAYSLLARSGCDTTELLERHEGFAALALFDTPDTANALGSAVSDITEMGLREIASAVLAIKKEEQNRTFATQVTPAHNESKTMVTNDERSADDGVDLRDGGRLPAPEPDSRQPAKDARQIRERKGALSERPQKSALHEPEDERQIDRAPLRDRAGSQQTDGAAGGSDGTKRERDGGTESARPDELGTQDELHQEPSPRDSGKQPDLRLGHQLQHLDQKAEDSRLPFFDSEGKIKEPLKTTHHHSVSSKHQQREKRTAEPNLQLSLFLPSEAEQQASIEADNNELPAFFISGDGRDATIEVDDDFDVAGLASRQVEHEGMVLAVEAVDGESNNFVIKDAKQPTKPHELLNFHITDDKLGHGTAVERYAANVAAIKCLQQLETGGRHATATEQETLSRYVGFGAIPETFDSNNPSWAKRASELKALLPEEEYTAARASTLNAHFTSPVVIKSMYQALASFGFTKGNVLEPSCGIGNFMGLLPKSMKEAQLYGVELDPLTARIARELYQSANIKTAAFEQTDFPDNFFDIAIGNVPFGSYGVSDKRYDAHHFKIHDYFFAKTLDLVRPGGIVAFVTSKGTLDKENPATRRYLAHKADLIGAIRLPNTAFLDNAGTAVTSDVIFLQKRERPPVTEPDWVYLGKTTDGILLNQYFADHPGMVLGTMSYDSRMYGNEKTTTCAPFEGANLTDQLKVATGSLQAKIGEYQRTEPDEEDRSIPADLTVRNYSYTLVDGELYYREDSRMYPVEASATGKKRAEALIELRDCVRQLIELQTDDASDATIASTQARLNTLYDSLNARYGLINSRANAMAFSEDSSYPLLCSLEVIGESGELERKADMFAKRTIRPHTPATSADTPAEALMLSLSERAKVDLNYMAKLTGWDKEAIASELEGVIFKEPLTDDVWLAADEYLSGNVRDKLKVAELAVTTDATFAPNVEALSKVIPKDLDASEISVRLGATWLPPEIVKQFIFELLDTPYYDRSHIEVHFSQATAQWNISNKSRDGSNVKALSVYGTRFINAYHIIEQTLNLRDVRIYKTVSDAEGKDKRVLDTKETAIAQSKQEAIKAAFQDWIWDVPERRERLVRLYNDRFNSMRLRTFDGSHLSFPGMNPAIELKEHQLNAVARILYGGNTLLGHVVGAGKTFAMVAAAQESKRLGLCAKSLIVVPNHLTDQWAGEYLQLYPSANILVATKRDFERKNRRRFCARIATGDFDAVIIGHSQFERIPMSAESQKELLQSQIYEVVCGIAEMKANHGGRFTIKQLENTKKTLEVKLNRLNDQTRKDDVITFEELGVDRLFIDESHNYKNLFLYTKMRNVGGIAQTEAQKSSDLFMKCCYLDKKTGSKGIIFATGTPISNSMVELYTIQRYLQYGELCHLGLQHFDSWASTFGETITAIELAPEGTGYRQKTRFAKFYNLPELMMMFRQVADIQTADMLNLPVPKVNFHNVSVKPSEFQTELVLELGARADKVRKGLVNPSEDNMLKITNDGRKLALDQRLVNPMLPDSPKSKVSVCCDTVFRIWEHHKDTRQAQLVFCDLSTPKTDGSFSVYHDIRKKLVAKGVPIEEIVFIHDTATEAKKAELFAKVRAGTVRGLLGSTAKMGAGTNVQTRLIALHDLDVPWRPSDLAQRLGRIERQGNTNSEVEVFRYVTENTFDAYCYQLVENKQKFIGQVMTSKSPVRSAADVDETALSYAEIKALATGNPAFKEKMDLDVEVARLKMLKANHQSQRFALQDALIQKYPKQIKLAEEKISGLEADIATLAAHTFADKEDFTITIGSNTYQDKAAAGAAILAFGQTATPNAAVSLGHYRGFDMEILFSTVSRNFVVMFVGNIRHDVSLGDDPVGCIIRMDNVLAGLPEKLAAAKEQLANTHVQVQNAKAESEKPFAQEDELRQKSERLRELDLELGMDAQDGTVLDDGRGDGDIRPEPDRER
jgi:N12 class adenine-specific DNA methylase/adenine-specific DNA methylase